MNLTQEQMSAALFADIVSHDARVTGVSPEEYVRIMTQDFPAFSLESGEIDEEATRLLEEEAVARYRNGCKILKPFVIQRVGVGTVPYMTNGSLSPAATLPLDSAGHIVAESGWIGAAQNYAVLVFVPRLRGVED